MLINTEVTVVIIKRHRELYVYEERFRGEKIPNILHHPNIAQIYSIDVFDENIYLVLPCYSRSADYYKGNIDETKLWHFILDVSAGLAYLHSHGIIHLNIRPDTIFEDANGNFVIFSYRFNPITKTLDRTNSSSHWSSSYWGPEMFADNIWTKATDIWALGATLYEMATGELPFFGRGGIMQFKGARLPEIRGNYSDDFRQIVQMCLAKEIWDRPSAEQLVTYANAIFDGKQFSRRYDIKERVKHNESSFTTCPKCHYPLKDNILLCPNCGFKSSYDCSEPLRYDECEMTKVKKEYQKRTREDLELEGSTMDDAKREIVNRRNQISSHDSFEPAEKQSSKRKSRIWMFWQNLYQKIQNLKGSSFSNEVYSSIFAPAEVKRKSHMQVQVYLHLFEETEKVKALAQEPDKNAERRDYVPLQCKLRRGDKVDVLLNIYDELLLYSDKKSVIWQGSFNKCSFDYFVPKEIDVDELSCVALLTVNEIPIGEMRFITKIVDAPRQLNTEIIAHKFNKVFISYSHLDEEKVRFYHEGMELAKVPHFFDRSYLKTGDVFPQVIQNYINSADLFILFWSENASKSEYVEKERKQALERAFPQVKPQQAAKLSIYPISIEPRAELPSDMKESYHFGEI